MATLQDCIGRGTHSARPAAGRPGALYAESDTGFIYRDNGSTWEAIAGANARTIIHTATDLTLTAANCVVVVTATGKTITLPPASANTGLIVTIRQQNTADGFYIGFPAGETPDPGYAGVTWAIMSLVSDGGRWFAMDY